MELQNIHHYYICFCNVHVLTGGIWVSPDKRPPGREAAATMYDALITNSSKEMMCFSDFPFDRSLPPYLRRKQLLPYYKDYAKHFGVDKHIRYKTAVLNVQPTDDFKETGETLFDSNLIYLVWYIFFS